MRRTEEYAKTRSGVLFARRNAEASYRRHAKKLAKEGWRPVETHWRREKPGCSTFWLVSPGGTLIVTYERDTIDT
jgi:hypothetical protein